MRWFGGRVAFLAALASLTGCYPSESLFIEEFDVVVTLYDEEIDFTKFNTYALPDTVIQIGDPDDPDFIDLELTRVEMDIIVGQVRSNMNALRYTEISDPVSTEPDIVIAIEALAQKKTVIFTYPGGGWGGYWGWYPGYSGWGWGPGWGGWYPPLVGSYSYSAGTLVVHYVDAGEQVVGSDDLAPDAWIGILNGILTQNSASDSRVTSGIDQMFDQSQYLRTN